MRILPNTIRIGNSYKLDIPLPEQPETDDAWVRVELELRRAVATEVTTYNDYTEVISEGAAEITITADSTRQWAAGEKTPDGVYRYAITCRSGDGFVSTVEDGHVIVRDPLDPALSHVELMVQVLEAVIEEKAEGRKDVLEYGISDRSTKSMTYNELIKALSDYKEALYYERRRKAGKRVI